MVIPTIKAEHLLHLVGVRITNLLKRENLTPEVQFAVQCIQEDVAMALDLLKPVRLDTGAMPSKPYFPYLVEPVIKPYWLCCGSTNPREHLPGCNEAKRGHPERCRFGTKEEHELFAKRKKGSCACTDPFKECEMRPLCAIYRAYVPDAVNADENGWIRWQGGSYNPVKKDTVVRAKLRDGTEVSKPANHLSWRYDYDSSYPWDVLFYKVEGL